ncbi:MAG: hypothetical protein U0237_11440 [Thermoleophilia bacterium]
MTAGTVELRAGDAAVAVDPAMGGRLVSWRVRGMELLGARGTVPEEFGCYPMAPWPGRLRGNAVRFAGAAHRLPVTYLGFAMHGTLLRRPMDVAHQTPHRVELRGELGPAWPWPGRATVIWELDAGRLRSRLEVATDGDPFPAELGWHPGSAAAFPTGSRCGGGWRPAPCSSATPTACPRDAASTRRHFPGRSTTRSRCPTAGP